MRLAIALPLLLMPTPALADPISTAILLALGTQTATALAVTLVTVALTTIGSLILNKLLAPKAKHQERQASVASLQIGENPREALFGTVATGGTLADAFNYGGTNGTDWEVLIVVVADHRCEDLTGFFVGDVFVAFTGDGAVTGYNSQLEVYWLEGTEAQTMPSIVTTYGGWDSDSNLAGCATVVVAYKADDPKASSPIWTGGRPSFLWVVKGKLCYIPRLDSTVDGGSGAHRWDDPGTWEWTDNPIDCRYNWMRGIYACDRIDQPGQLLVGRGLSATEAPPERTIAGANTCDELVDLEAGGDEKRYRCNAVIRADEEFIATEEMFAASCAGVIVQRQGGVEIEPGTARSVIAEITDADFILGETITFNHFKSDTQRVNSVIPRYVEPTQRWADHAAPIRRNLTDITGDGGPREETLTLSAVTSGTQAQRCGEIKRRIARLERSGGFTLGPRFAHIEDGDWIGWTSDRHMAGERAVFRITRYSLPSSWRNSLTFEEIAADCYDWDEDVDELIDTSVAEQQTPPAGSDAPDDADWDADALGASIIRVTGGTTDSNVAYLIIEYREDDASPPEDATDWIWSTNISGDLTAVIWDIAGLITATDYNVSLRFSFYSGGLSDRLILDETTP